MGKGNALGRERYGERNAIENAMGRCSGPTMDPDIHGCLAFHTKMKTFWVIKYLNIYSTNK